MRRLAFVPVLALLLALTVVPTAHAQACNADGFRQADMAGVYVDPASPMRVEIFPCGGVYVQWDNVYGRHYATYFSVGRLVDNAGVMAEGVTADPLSGTFLDGSYRIALKAAEPGYINVGTFMPYDDAVRVYRLRKIR